MTSPGPRTSMSAQLRGVKRVAPALKYASAAAVLEAIEDNDRRLNRPGTERCRELAERCIYSDPFEAFMGAVIVFYMIVMVVDINRSVTEVETHGMYWTDICGWIVLGVYVVEMCVRLSLTWDKFWKDRWSVFDFCLISLDACFSLLGLLGRDIFPISILRVARLAKLARIQKVLHVFPELRLLLGSLLRSWSAIFWGAVLLFLCILMWAMVAVLFIHPLNKNIVYDSSCERCPRAYHSVEQSMLTFWQQILAGDSWGQTTIPLMEKHPGTIPFFLGVYLTVGLALLNLIVGVVVDVAQRAKALLEQADSANDALDQLKSQQVFLQSCKELDRNGDGYVSREELMQNLEKGGPIRDCIDELGVIDDEIDIVWQMLDEDKIGRVSYKDFMHYVFGMKSSEVSFMLTYIKYYVTEVRDLLLSKRGETYEAFEEAKRDIAIPKSQEELTSNCAGSEVTSSHTNEFSTHKMVHDPQEFAHLRATLTQLELSYAKLVNLARVEPGVNSLHLEEITIEQDMDIDAMVSRIPERGYGLLTHQLDEATTCSQSMPKTRAAAVTTCGEIQTWNTQFVLELGRLRLELEDKLFHINRKLAGLGDVSRI